MPPDCDVVDGCEFVVVDRLDPLAVVDAAGCPDAGAGGHGLAVVVVVTDDHDDPPIKTAAATIANAN